MQRAIVVFSGAVVWGCLAGGSVFAQRDSDVPPDTRLGALRPERFVHVPGPNPVLVHGAPGEWDDAVIETADAIRDGDTYYLFYHGAGLGKSYRLGVALAAHPLGPFRKHGPGPVLDLGPPGSWDDRAVACAMVLKESDGQYRMFYSGVGHRDRPYTWHVGMATAPHPLGPWKKHDRNPILEDFGYVGGVVQVDGRYHLYAEHPIGATGPDYGPMSLAIAEDPAGPWTRWEKNPVLEAGKTGAWDAGGFSEAEVLRAGGGFCIFFGGAKLHPERIRSEESIGYAFSADGYRFTKHPDPVARRESVPNTAAMSEVHAIYEPPFVYLYHTLRYREPRRPQDRSRYPHIEDLGVEVIATDHPFKLQMPVLHRENLGPGEATNLFDCPPLCLATLTRAELQAECAFGRHATQGLQIRVHTSEDGLRWGDDAAFRLELPVQRSTTVRGTCVLEPKPRFAKVVVENLDTGTSVSTVRISASVSG